MVFEMKLEDFDGPLRVLLDLIHDEKLPITEVSLAQVTKKYLRYMDSHEVPVSELADFLVVATKLLLLKSQAILPVEVEPEEDASALALQLRLYKEFVDASKILEERFNDVATSFARAAANVVKLDKGEITTNLSALDLHGAFSRVLKRLEPLFKLQAAALERVVSVKERLREIHDAILNKTKMTFSQIAQRGKSKVDVVVSFLALLELIKQRAVSVIQSRTFDDIEIKRVD